MKIYTCEPTGSLMPSVFQGDIGAMVDHFEHPGRLERILQGTGEPTDVTVVRDGATDQELTTVHDPAMIGFFREMAATDPAIRPRFPDSFPEAQSPPPRALRGRFGYYCTDTQTPFIDQYWNDALRAARCALVAAEALGAGDQLVYAASRPPGHHAGPGFFGGFCYLNNTALAASRLSEDGRVAVFDIDYHHGNGTQQCFYNTGSVLTVSVHADAADEYPFFSGDPGETGAQAGTGFNRNFPVPLSATRDSWFAEFGRAIDVVRDYDPKHLVVAFGADTYKDDPVGGLALEIDDYREIGSRIAAIDRSTLVVQEGGYALDVLPAIVSALMSGFENR